MAWVFVAAIILVAAFIVSDPALRGTGGRREP